MSEFGRLAGKRTLVTGAGSGIGRAIAVAFAAEGAAVACVDIDEESARETVSLIAAGSGRSFAVHCDVSELAAVRQLLESLQQRLRGLDVLVNNAAFFATRMPVGRLDEALWERTMAVNLTGCYLMSRYAIPIMTQGGGGSIIHVASAHAHVANHGQAAYCASKAGLLMLSKGIAVDHAKNGIRSNTLSPGGIATQGMADLYGGDWQRAETEWGKPMHVLGRNGRVEEVAAGAVFLASDEASFTTGTDLLVDGGYTAR